MTRWTYNPETLPVYFKTPDVFIVNRLNHVPFMAWLTEVRDQRDARIMKEIALHRARYNNDSPELCADVTGILGDEPS